MPYKRDHITFTFQLRNGQQAETGQETLERLMSKDGYQNVECTSQKIKNGKIALQISWTAADGWMNLLENLRRRGNVEYYVEQAFPNSIT